ncbi:MAG: hypothetical protein HY677_01170, partial [Chloroflexi bacterium]|nr:hypothetical protein [Chloroflexota bacterium]
MPLIFSVFSFVAGFFGSVIAVAFSNARASLRPQTRRDKSQPEDYGL